MGSAPAGLSLSPDPALPELVSYARRRSMDGNRIIAITFVAVIHILLGYALVTGLAYTVIEKAADNLKTFDVEEEPRARSGFWLPSRHPRQ